MLPRSSAWTPNPPLGLVAEALHRPARDPGEALQRLIDVRPRTDEQGIDDITRVEARLAHQLAQRVRPP